MHYRLSILQRLEKQEKEKQKRLRQGYERYLAWAEKDRRTYPIAGFGGKTAAQIFGETAT